MHARYANCQTHAPTLQENTNPITINLLEDTMQPANLRMLPLEPHSKEVAPTTHHTVSD